VNFLTPDSGPRITKDKIDYQELWQYFESRGSALKDSFLSIATLLLGFASAALGFAIDKALDFGPEAKRLVTQPQLLFLLSVIGAVLITYALMVTYEFGRHINRNFDRAEYTMIGDRPLDEILSFSEQPARLKRDLPRICITVRRLVLGFGVLFVTGLVLAIRA